MRTFCAMLLTACGIATSQTQTVAISNGAPNAAFTILGYYPSSTVQYYCKAQSQPAISYSWVVTAAGGSGVLTSIVVLTNAGTITTTTAHGLAVGNVVTVSGSTTSALNGSYIIQTVGSTTTFTITTVAVSNATYNNAALKVSTAAPRTSAAQWAVQRVTLDGSGNLTAGQWAADLTSGAGGSTSYRFICDNRGTLAYQ